ncbi:MAG: EF-hand domain-containing protein [Hyphomicrobiaceae bacterium]|nr:EF-hand domain-containing protein [Hyphomicrobiaceae bacterium]
MRLGHAILLSSVLVLPSMAMAEEEQKPEVPPVLLKNLRGSKEDYVSRTLKPIRQYGENRTTISKAGVELVESELDAQMRGQFLGQEFRKDLDGDGRISLREMRRAHEKSLRRLKEKGKPERYTKTLAKKLETSMQADKNSDGYVSFDELMAQAKLQLRKSRAQRSRIFDMKDMLELDPNKDDVLSIAELRPLLDKTFARFDTNKNGWIDPDEQKAVREVNKQQRAKTKPRVTRNQLATCELPPASKDALVVVLGSYGGHAISSVSVAGQNKVTHTGTITIEPGEKQIYLVIGARAHMVWDFKGATNRIERIVAFSGLTNGGAGSVGIPADKVTFLASGSCFRHFRNGTSGRARIAKAVVEGALKRNVDAVVGIGEVSNMHLPSGTQANINKPMGPTVETAGGKKFVISKDGVKPLSEVMPKGLEPPTKVDKKTWAELHRFNPGGIVQLDAKNVIGNGEVEKYEVMPQQAGLVQLMQEGAIRRLNDGFYLIEKPIARYPAGLGGAHSVKFLLGKGVPQPPGKPGHSCVVSEENGKPLFDSARRC